MAPVRGADDDAAAGHEHDPAPTAASRAPAAAPAVQQAPPAAPVTSGGS